MNIFTRYTFSTLFLVNVQAITADNIITIANESQFDKEIIQSGKPSVVKVGANWCSYCKQSEKPYHRLSNDYPNVVFTTIDLDKNGWISNRYGVQSLPTLLYFNNGKLVSKKVGYEKDEVTSTLRSMQSGSTVSGEKKSPTQEQTSAEAQINQPIKQLAPEAMAEQASAETEALACPAQSESIFERAFNAARDFFANIGSTIRGWFK